MRNTRFLLAAIAAYAIWGFFSLVLKPLATYSSIDILFYRVFLCAAVLLLISVLFRKSALRQQRDLFRSLSSMQKKRNISLNVLGAVLLTVNWFSFIYVMNHVSVKATSLAYLVCPILTAFLAEMILKEKLKRQQWLGIGISIAGCLLLSYARMTDMISSLVVASSYAFYLISQRVNSGFDKLFVLTFQICCSAIFLLPLYPLFSGSLPTSAQFYGYIVVISLFFTILPLWLNLYALKGLKSSTVGMMLNINPLIAFTLAVLVYQEPVDSLQVLAYAIILVAVLIFNTHTISRRR